MAAGRVNTIFMKNIRPDSSCRFHCADEDALRRSVQDFADPAAKRGGTVGFSKTATPRSTRSANTAVSLLYPVAKTTEIWD